MHNHVWPSDSLSVGEFVFQWATNPVVLNAELYFTVDLRGGGGNLCLNETTVSACVRVCVTLSCQSMFVLSQLSNKKKKKKNWERPNRKEVMQSFQVGSLIYSGCLSFLEYIHTSHCLSSQFPSVAWNRLWVLLFTATSTEQGQLATFLIAPQQIHWKVQWLIRFWLEAAFFFTLFGSKLSINGFWLVKFGLPELKFNRCNYYCTANHIFWIK